MMPITLDTTLTGRVAALLREIEQTEQAKPLVAEEVQAALAHLDGLSIRAEAASPSLWLSAGPAFSTQAFNDALLAAPAAIAPEQTRQMVADRAKRYAATWQGLRMSAAEKERRLTKLRNDLRIARARLEQARREIEEWTGEMQPRPGDDAAVWLLLPTQLSELAAGNGRAR